MVGALRQEKKETGEMEFYEIQMGRNLNVEQPKEDDFVPSKYRGNDPKAEFKEKIQSLSEEDFTAIIASKPV